MTFQTKASSQKNKTIMKIGLIRRWAILSVSVIAGFIIRFCILSVAIAMGTANANVVDEALAGGDLSKAYGLAFERATEGSPEAQYQFAVMCRNGQGAEADPIEAAKWFRFAAVQGHLESQEQLALALLSGNGVGQDQIEAAKWLGLAAKQDSPSALYMLANMHLVGEGVRQDNLKAYELFGKSADLGYTKSMIKQADMLIYGRGVKKNIYKAIVLYQEAELAGDHYAKLKNPELDKQKLCLFSAKTQLFGRYLKCVSGKELHRKLFAKGVLLNKKPTKNYQKTYDSSRLIKGSRSLELLLTKNDRIARLQYIFDRNEDANGRSNSAVQPPSISKVREMLEQKYGRYHKKEGILGAGEIQYEWLLKDQVTIVLHQQSPLSEMKLAYVIKDRLSEFYADRKMEKQEAASKVLASDADFY